LGKHDTKTLTAEIKRMIDNPFEADGEFYHQRLSDPTYAGKHEVTSNELTRIGALCFIPKFDPRKHDHRVHHPHLCYPHHEHSAARFKNEYEALYGSVSPAVDPAREPVQSSPTAHDNGMAARIDRADSIRMVLFGSQKPPSAPVLDAEGRDLLISAICFGDASEKMVDKLPSGKANWRKAQARSRRVLFWLAVLSRWWGYVSEREVA
jgi:hypothetical protein